MFYTAGTGTVRWSLSIYQNNCNNIQSDIEIMTNKLNHHSLLRGTKNAMLNETMYLISTQLNKNYGEDLDDYSSFNTYYRTNSNIFDFFMIFF